MTKKLKPFSPLVSIIIRTKNEERWIGHCLKRIHSQNYDNYEIILVDSNSEDNTVEKAKRIGIDKIVKIKDYRPGLAINEGINISSGEFIIILSAHCLPISNNWINEMVDEISSDEKIAGVGDAHAIADGAVPGCTYCRPQVASVGMTEAAAKKAGHKIKVGQFPFAGNGKAIALGDDAGFVKTIFDAATGELLGAHMVGPEVTELIQGFAIARRLEATEAELMSTIFPHPTLSEAMHESVLDAFSRAIHY